MGHTEFIELGLFMNLFTPNTDFYIDTLSVAPRPFFYTPKTYRMFDWKTLIIIVFVGYLFYLSYDVESESEIMPCVKIDKSITGFRETL